MILITMQVNAVVESMEEAEAIKESIEKSMEAEGTPVSVEITDEIEI